MRSDRCTGSGGEACNNAKCWQHAARKSSIRNDNSHSSSTSSGCDSNSSSKENFFGEQHQQHHSLTPQQLQQIRYYQYLQQQQLQLLQQQLEQRRRLQQHLREQGVTVGGASKPTTSPALTCNQQYLIQQRLQQQQQHQLPQLRNANGNNCYNDNDILNNNNCSNNNNFGEYAKGQKFQRGMTEFSTSNEINNKSHLSQPLQNSSRHFINPHQQQHQNSPQHFANNINKHFAHALKQQQSSHNNKNNQQTLPLNSSANISNNINATSSATSSATHSPLHYRNPLNSPNNSPFAFAYYGAGGGEQQQQRATATAQQQQSQQHFRSSKLPPILTQTQYQQHLTDLLLQQQHLQQQQQKLLSAGRDADADELSEESLKQNVAIVLNNLDRYNNALRSVILNEQVISSTTSCNSVFFDDSLLDGSTSNNNFLLNSNFAMAGTPESDYNSNATTPGSRCNMPLDSNMLPQQHLVGFANAAAAATCIGGGGGGVNSMGGGNGFCTIGNNVASNNLNCSLASSHDFSHDNSDYQWFLDYGYRDGCSGMQRSVLSSLSASYNGIGDLIYYEDLAKNLDANLAEVDMESFRAEDIHSLLSQLPSYCKSLGGNNRLQQSLMLQQQMLPLTNQQTQMTSQTSQTSLTSNNELIDNSICKSELLFSPVKESHISVDSLDMDAYPDDGDIILTCKANKDNYTIAFEGSVLYSDDSFYAEPNEIAMKNKQNFINLHSNLEDIVKRKSLEVSMSRSEQAFTGRSNKLQKSNTTQLQRYPSGNNNTSDAVTVHIQQHLPYCTVRKSSSLPNLKEATVATCERQQYESDQPQQPQQQLNVSQAVSTSTMDSCKSRNLLPMCQMPISCSSTSASISERLTCQQQQQQMQQPNQQQQQRHKHRCCCTASSPLAAGAISSCAAGVLQKNAHISGSTSSGSSNPPAFNLVKLFIKQKSSNCSTEDQVSAHTCMDISSGCWPSSDAAGSSSSSSLEQRLRKKSMNDSGKGSALSRHDEEDRVRDDADESAFQSAGDSTVGHTTPKRHLRVRNDAAFYDEDHSASSTGSLTATNSPAHRRRSVPLRNPQLCQLVSHHNTATSAGSLQSSDGSRSNSEQLTQVYVSPSVAANSSGAKVRRPEIMRTMSTASSSEMITRSMQTSCGGSLSTRSSLSERFRCVPPSFLAKLNNLGEERQAPIYVIYPNYALPDLGFVKTSPSPDVIFSPFNYKMAVAGNMSASSASSLRKRGGIGDNADEVLKNMDYKHVVDWQSLTTLLPAEYRRRLKHIPEVKSMLVELDAEQSQRPLFCMTPPIRRSKPHICDCAKYFQQQAQVQTQQEGSSSSGSSQQPSSGYRGSSTLLTDSEIDAADPLKQMYVYQYEQQRMDSGVEMSPSASKTPPQPKPRGILRKSSSASRTKRNSMIEDQQQTKLSKLEKRRSLQEPPYQLGLGSAEELYEVFEEESEFYDVPQPRKERLSRKDLDARVRAENFLSSLPRSELKYYAEIASILELSSEHHVEYDAAALKKEVSRALSQQKKVSFNDIDEPQGTAEQQHQALLHTDKRFTTPPNSPNISIAGGGLRMHAATGNTVPRRVVPGELHTGSERKKLSALEEREQRKIESNRFKRLQIQWELMSKDSSMLKDLASAQHTKSGGSTPTSATAAHKSRIPRPVSYPAGKKIQKAKSESHIPEKRPAISTKIPCMSPHSSRISTQDAISGKTTRSPSRIVPPKRYSMATPGAATATTPPSSAAAHTTTIGGSTRARTPTATRTAATAPNTPKRRVQSPRTIPRVR